MEVIYTASSTKKSKAREGSSNDSRSASSRPPSSSFRHPSTDNASKPSSTTRLTMSSSLNQRREGDRGSATEQASSDQHRPAEENEARQSKTVDYASRNMFVSAPAAELLPIHGAPTALTMHGLRARVIHTSAAGTTSNLKVECTTNPTSLPQRDADALAVDRASRTEVHRMRSQEAGYLMTSSAAASAPTAPGHTLPDPPSPILTAPELSPIPDLLSSLPRPPRIYIVATAAEAAVPPIYIKAPMYCAPRSSSPLRQQSEPQIMELQGSGSAWPAYMAAHGKGRNVLEMHDGWTEAGPEGLPTPLTQQSKAQPPSLNSRADPAATCTASSYPAPATSSTAVPPPPMIDRFQSPAYLSGKATRGVVQALACGHAAHARTYFKLVFVRPDGVPLSIHTRTTSYPMNTTLVQASLHESDGALHGMSSLLEAILKEDQKVVAHREGLHLSLAVAKVLAWNADRMDHPRSNGAKKELSFVKVIELLPVPVSYISSLGRPAAPVLPKDTFPSERSVLQAAARTRGQQEATAVGAPAKAAPTERGDEAEGVDQKPEGRSDLNLNLSTDPVLALGSCGESSQRPSIRASTSAWWAADADHAPSNEVPRMGSVSDMRPSSASLASSKEATRKVLKEVYEMEQRLRHLRGIDVKQSAH